MLPFSECSWSVAASYVPTWDAADDSRTDQLQETLQTLNDEFDTEDYSGLGCPSLEFDAAEIAVTRSA